MRLEQADIAHKRSKDGVFRLHIVHHPDVETLFGICRDFIRTLREAGADDAAVSEGRSHLYRFRRLAVGLPLSFDDPAVHIAEIRDVLRRAITNPNYGSAVPHLTQAISVAESLLATPANPIDEALRGLAEQGAVVVTRDSHMSTVLSTWLDVEFGPLKLKAISVGELKSRQEARKLIYLGDPLSMAKKFSGEDWRFARDPRAFESHFIMYPFGEPNLQVPGLLPGGSPHRKISAHVPLQVPHFDPIADSETEWSVEERGVVSRNISSEDELVLARYIRLAGDHYTFLDAQPDTKVFVVTADSLGKLDVQREVSSQLEVGSFIVLRVEGAESDFIQQEADRLGAGNLRVSQRRWQSALRAAKSRDGSLTRMRERLKSEFDLDNHGLADWLNNPRRIGPGSKADFIKLCKYLDISNECEALWVDLEKIRGYHLQAGAHAAKTLRKLLEKRDAGDPELGNPGFMTVDGGDLGAIGVYRILAIGNTSPVDVWRIETVEKIAISPSTTPER
jgi:hypothetical protein